MEDRQDFEKWALEQQKAKNASIQGAAGLDLGIGSNFLSGRPYWSEKTSAAYAAWQAGRMAERERIADIVEHYAQDGVDLSLSDVAKLIRGEWKP